MVRDEPVDPPPKGAIASTIESALGWTVTDVTPFEEGLNAVYHVDRADGDPAVLKVATYVTDDELLTEAALVSRFGTETNVPLPSVFAVLDATDTPVGAAAFVMEYCDGRVKPDVLDLPADARTRLVAESGRHLGGIHEVPIVGEFGRLTVENGEVRTVEGYEAWPSWFDDLADMAAAALEGAGVTTDDDPRFADLAADVRETVTATVAGEDPPVGPSLLVGDYRPANLVLSPSDGADPLIRAVIDLGNGPVGDGLLDLAAAEDAMVDVPLGATPAAERLRERLRTAYCEVRGIDPGVLESERYACYRLYARAWRMASFEYWHRFAREGDPDAVARRWRSFAHDRLSELK